MTARCCSIRPVICEYLNQLGGGKFFPGMSIWRAEQRPLEGAGPAGAGRRHRRCGGGAWWWSAASPTPNEAHIARQHAAVEAGLDALERVKFAESPTIGEIAVACALGYIDFRLPDLDWRATPAQIGGLVREILAISRR